MMRYIRQAVAGFIALLSLLLPLAAIAQAAWPEKPVHFIVPFADGSAVDQTTRIFSERLSARLGRPFVVDNRAGANAIVGAVAAARAPADGYNFFFTTSTTHAANVALYDKLPYDPVRDFEPVAFIQMASYLLVVNNDLPVRSVKEFIAYAKERPGKLNYSTGAANSLAASEMFKIMTGTDIVQINYKSNPDGLAALMAGSTHMMFADFIVARPQVLATQVRALGVTSPGRHENMPDVPTVAEAGVPGFGLVAWQAIYAPARTPRAAIQRLNAEVNAIRSLPETRKRLVDMGYTLEGVGPTPEDLATFNAREIAMWTKLVAEARLPKQ
jgi:tripartite-type tricarboxylate transporter receptor subunit TctC